MPRKNKSLEKRLLPSHYPEIAIPQKWKREFTELLNTGLYNQTEALDKIASSCNVHRITVYRNIFPEQKEKLKKCPSRQWNYTKMLPEFSRKRFNIERAKRERVKYNIAAHLFSAYITVDHEPQELVNLSKIVKMHTGVNFIPSTFLSLNTKYEKKYGHPIIQRDKRFVLHRYKLHPKIRHKI